MTSVIVVTEEPVPPPILRLTQTVTDLAIIPISQIDEVFQFLEINSRRIDIVIIESATITTQGIEVTKHFQEFVVRLKNSLSTAITHFIGLFPDDEIHEWSSPKGIRCCYPNNVNYLFQEMKLIPGGQLD